MPQGMPQTIKLSFFSTCVLFPQDIKGHIGKKMSAISFDTPFHQFHLTISNLTNTLNENDPETVEVQLARLQEIVDKRQELIQSDLDEFLLEDDGVLEEVETARALVKQGSNARHEGDPLWLYDLGYPMDETEMLNPKYTLNSEKDYCAMLELVKKSDVSSLYFIRVSHPFSSLEI